MHQTTLTSKWTLVFSLVLFILLTNTLTSHAQPVSEDEARTKAARFLASRSASGNSQAKHVQRKAPRLVASRIQRELYVFNDEANGGFVVVSGDERTPEILGYSFSGGIDAQDMPTGLQAWLDDYAKQIRVIQERNIATPMTSLLPESLDYVEPLIETTWNQRAPYYNMCPKTGGKQTLTGCCATAMAQVMNYYKWPKKTSKTIPAYTTASLSIYVPAISVTTIDWDNMLDNYYTGKYTTAEGNAVATLMKLCGAAVQMDYTPTWSSGGVGPETLSEYFEYDFDMMKYVEAKDYTARIWNRMIYDEIDADRPVIYWGYPLPGDRSGGHIFIVDGYDCDDYFHINWGWGGYEDGYYLLSALLPGNENYSNGQGALIGITPLTADKPRAYAVLADSTLSFYYDGRQNERAGKVFSPISGNPWMDYREQVAECVIDVSMRNYAFRDLTSTFYGMKNMRSVRGLENMDVSQVTNMAGMFDNCSSLTSLDLSSWDTSNLDFMNFAFEGCSSLESLNVSGWKTDKVTSMKWLFLGCSSLKHLDLSTWRTDKVENMYMLFDGCSSLESLDLTGWKVNNVTDMHAMFSGCNTLKSLNLNGWKVNNVTDMGLMFANCSALRSLDVAQWFTTKVTDMSSMFNNCYSLQSLTLYNWYTSKVKDMSYMFYDCNALTTIYVGSGWSLLNVTNSENMFGYCDALVGGEGTQNEYGKWDATYAHVDGGPNNPGYLTYLASYDAIQPPLAPSSNCPASIFTLDGRRLASPQRGLNIVDGKKLVIKH